MDVVNLFVSNVDLRLALTFRRETHRKNNFYFWVICLQRPHAAAPTRPSPAWPALALVGMHMLLL